MLTANEKVKIRQVEDNEQVVFGSLVALEFRRLVLHLHLV
jgi:hypothetical protein